jgi:hypothetical protein
MRGSADGAANWVRPGAPAPRNENERLLAYFEYLRRLAPADLVKEHETSRSLYASARTDFNRVRYAIVAGLPGVDETRALEALGPLLKAADAPLHGLAFMVAAQIQEQRRAQGMHEKLDALKLLEKQMIERDPATSTRRP